jgi:hypothetical protein
MQINASVLNWFQVDESRTLIKVFGDFKLMKH